MSFFGWFKSAPKPNNDPIALARDARFGDPKDAAARAAEASAAERRKDERARQRELLFKVVRESMVRVGVLSGSIVSAIVGFVVLRRATRVATQD